jgi:hypothetical protein
MTMRAILLIVVLLRAVAGAEDKAPWRSMVTACVSAKRIHVAASVLPPPDFKATELRYVITDPAAKAKLNEVLSEAVVRDTGTFLPEGSKVASKQWFEFQVEDEGGEIKSFRIMGSSSLLFGGSMRLYEVEKGGRFTAELTKALLQVYAEGKSAQTK